MTNEERDKLINSILPDTVKGQSRPAENLNPDMPYSTDFPQLINKDPASADVFNLINHQHQSQQKKNGCHNLTLNTTQIKRSYRNTTSKQSFRTIPTHRQTLKRSWTL